MRVLICALIILLSACTTTHISRTDGINKFEASNTSIGWDREDLSLTLKKSDQTMLEVSIGKSGGTESFNRGVEFLEKAIESFKKLGGN